MRLSQGRHTAALGIWGKIQECLAESDTISVRSATLRQSMRSWPWSRQAAKLRDRIEYYDCRLKDLQDVCEVLQDRLWHLIDVELAEKDPEYAELLIALAQCHMLQKRMAWCAGASLGLRYHIDEQLRNSAPINFPQLNRDIQALQAGSAYSVALVESLFQGSALAGWSHDFKPPVPSLLLDSVGADSQIQEVRIALSRYQYVASEAVDSIQTILQRLTPPYKKRRQSIWDSLLLSDD